MSANTLTIQSYRKLNPVPKRRLHAIKSRKVAREQASVISFTESLEVLNPLLKSDGLNGWVMPPIIYPYFKGRDNDPL